MNQAGNSIKVSFVIIEFYSVVDVVTCVESIRKSISGVPFEIIVSSNSSYPLSYRETLEKQDPGLRWTFNPRNDGFAYGMNRGLSLCRGEYLVTVNPDVRIAEGLMEMIEFMDNCQSVGAVGPAMVDDNGNIQDSCRRYVTLPGFLIRQLRRIFSDHPSIHERGINYSAIQTVDWIIGAFIMVRRDAFVITKGMDEGYRFYAEDLDWCTRIRKAGFEIVYFPDAKIRYSGTRSARKHPLMSLLFLRSHLRYWWRTGFFYGYPQREVMRFHQYSKSDGC